MSKRQRDIRKPLLGAALPAAVLVAALVGACQGTIGADGAPSSKAEGDSGAPKKSDASVSPRHDASGDATALSPETGLPPPPPFSPTTGAAALTKVKTVLTGLPPTPAELAAMAKNPASLRDLVAQWILTPQYQQKMLQFFEVAFQQNQSVLADFASQMPDQLQFAGQGYTSLMLANYHEMFARTALELIAEGRPFTDTFTTTRFMLTPALAASMALLDSQHQNDDSNSDVDENFRRYPGINVTFESDGPVPSSQLSDPTSPNFMHFFSSSVSPGATNPCLKSPVTYTPFPAFARAFDDTLYLMFMGGGFRPSESGPLHDPFTDAGVPFTDGGNLPPGSCDNLIDTSTLALNDFSHWRMVNVRKPSAGEAPTPFWDYETLRSGSELVFNIERIGFFTTPSFLASWNTNSSNQARVTINQTLIVALNQAFDGTDSTQPHSTAAVDQSHLLPGCIDCHRQLDPMRQFFRHDFTIPFHEYIDAGGHPPDAGAGDPSIPPQFVWGGVSQQGASIADLAKLLTQQSAVPAAWAQKLCQWGNSASCDAKDPEFQRIVGVFQDSNFNWSSLVVELFSSPIVTYLSDTTTADTIGETFPIARQGHLCALLSNRLGIPDICGLNPATTVPYTLKVATIIAGAYPSDQFSRGQVNPSVFVLANDPNLFTRTGLENLCISLANTVIDTTGSKYSSHQPTVAINDFVYNLMGLSGDRAAPMLELLNEHYTDALAEKGDAGTVTPTVALRSTFTLACLSPYVVGLGQ